MIVNCPLHISIVRVRVGTTLGPDKDQVGDLQAFNNKSFIFNLTDLLQAEIMGGEC